MVPVFNKGVDPIPLPTVDLTSLVVPIGNKRGPALRGGLLTGALEGPKRREFFIGSSEY